MTTPSSLTRRDCLKQAVLTGTAFTILPSRLRGENAPSKRVNLALIGTDRIVLASNLKTLLAMKDVRVVAVCDADRLRMSSTTAGSFRDARSPTRICHRKKYLRNLK